MKTMKNIFSTAALVLMGAASLTSCTDGNDWDVDSAFDRLFGTSDISITAQDTKAAISFTKTSGATAYQVELSTDSLYADDVSKSSILDTLTNTPDTLYNLNGETKYYLRMRSIADGKNNSKWVYYTTGSGKYYFTTKSEQLFYDLTENDYDFSECKTTWKAGSAVDSITVWKGDEEVMCHVLTAEEITAGAYTIDGLNPTTTYTIYLKNGIAKRGTLTLTTTSAPPAASITYRLSSDVTVLSQSIIDEVAKKAQEAAGSTTNYSATIVIPAGSELDVHGTAEDGGVSTLNIPDGMSVTFFGNAGTKTPTLKLSKTIDVAGSHSFVTFENLDITDNGAGYFINQSANATVDQFNVTGCDVSGFSTAFFRIKDSNGVTINNLNLTNSIFHDMCSGYSFIHVDAGSGAGKVNNIKISNCTLYNIATGGKMFIFSKKTNMNSIEIDHMTMYNCIGNGNYFVDFGDSDHGPSTFTISNSLFTKTPDTATGKNIRSSLTPTVSNSYSTNDFYKVLKGVEAWTDVSSEAVFTDPANANFTLTSKYANLGIGDSRWIVVSE